MNAKASVLDNLKNDLDYYDELLGGGMLEGYEAESFINSKIARLKDEIKEVKRGSALQLELRKSSHRLESLMRFKRLITDRKKIKEVIKRDKKAILKILKKEKRLEKEYTPTKTKVLPAKKPKKIEKVSTGSIITKLVIVIVLVFILIRILKAVKII